MCLCACLAADDLRIEGVVDVSRASHEIGHCYIAPIDAPGSPDTPVRQASSLQLLEDDVELGPAHSQHATIRELGGGAFSHWSGNADGKPQSLYFSASDNTDPTKNGRAYRWVLALDRGSVRAALRPSLVHGSRLGPEYGPGWYVALQIARSFPPFTADAPEVVLQGVDGDGNMVGEERRLRLTPGEPYVLGSLTEISRKQAVVRATVPLENLPEGSEMPMVELTLPTDERLELDVTGAEWNFASTGPWVDLPDARKLRGMRYPWRVSTTGETAELTREVTIPADWEPPFTLTFFCSDDYLDVGSRPDSGSNSVDAYPGHRLKQVLIDGEVIWEQDIADNSAPGAPVDFAVDLTGRVQPGESFTIALRNLDKVGMDTRLETDYHYRGVYEGDRPGGDEVLATTCWWGDVVVWRGKLSHGPAWPRPSFAQVVARHAEQWPYPPAGGDASLPANLQLEGADGPLAANAPVTCGVPISEGVVDDIADLSLWLGDEPLAWQPETMNTWPDGSARWVMVNAVLPAGTQPDAGLSLRREQVEAVPDTPVSVARDGHAVTVTSGDLTVRMGASDSLIESIEWAGERIAGPLQSEVVWEFGDGEPRALQAVWDSFEVTRSGPVRATIEARGVMADGAGSLGPVICRVDVYAGAPTARITHRIFNDGAGTAELSLVRLSAQIDDDAQRAVRGSAGDSATSIDGTEPTRLAQTDAGHWNDAAGASIEGRLDGWMAVEVGGAWLGATARHFWQQFPAALEATSGALHIDLFAGSESSPTYGCRAGEAKRHEVWLTFGPDQPALMRRPLRLFNSSYFCASEGLGYARPHDGEFANVGEHMAKTYPAAVYGSMALLFGIRDFGDGYYTAETPSYRNNYYDVMRGMFGEYLMGGGGEWFDRGEEAARHYMDIDQFHASERTRDFVGGNSSVYTPNHNEEFGVWAAMLRPAGGMLTCWRLSGDEDARESALMLADYIVRTRAGEGEGSSRNNAGSLHSLTWACDETGDQKYLEAALDIADSVNRFLIPRRGCYAETHGGHNYRGNVPWMDAQLAEPLYMLYRQTGEVWVADMMVGLMESLVAENMELGNPGNFQGYTHCPVLHRSKWNSGYNVLIAPCVGLAHELTGDDRMLAAMRGAYDITVEEGTINDVRNCYWMMPTLLYLLDRQDSARAAGGTEQ